MLINFYNIYTMEIKSQSLFSMENQVTENLNKKIQFFIEANSYSQSRPDSPEGILVKFANNAAQYDFMEENHRVIFFLGERAFELNEATQMMPTFSINQTKQYSIQSIDLYLDEQKITIANIKGSNALTDLYKKLKKTISHKGFNEYFKPIKRLGRGSFAAVYLIEHKYTGERFAAKVFSREGQRINESGQEALDNEIRMLKSLDHPNIIAFDGIYETANLIYMVTEYLSGGTLEHFMRAKFNNLGDYISEILSDILQALKYLQALDIMHRDLKPDNILLREKDKKWVLIDFGLAAFTSQNYLYTKCGTLGYIAPEVMDQNQSHKKYSFACDNYSTGVIIYTMIMGCLPFEIEKEGMYEMKVIWNAFKNVEFKQLDQQIKDLLRGLLQKDPIKRITPKEALQSSFFTSPKVLQNWKLFNDNKIKQTYNKILKMRNN